MIHEIMVNIHIEPLGDGGYLATSEDIDGLVAQGRTVTETMEIARDVARKLIEAHLEHNDPLPENIRRALETENTAITIPIPVSVSEYVEL